MSGDLADRADDIWHRALDGEPASGLPGDVAICAVLLFHGMAMNGGVLNAVESEDEEFQVAAEEGYRWLGLPGVADLLAEVRREVAEGIDHDRADALEVASDERYDRLVPDDMHLGEVLMRRVAAAPEAFAD